MKPPFPSSLSATSIANFRACEKLYEWNNLLRLEPRGGNVDFVAGGAYASGLETCRRAFYINKIPEPEAIQLGVIALWKSYGNFECPEGHPKSVWNTTHALLHYFKQWPIGTDYIRPYLFGEKHAIEFNFALPIAVLHPITGLPLFYSGKADMFAEFQSSLWNEDDKTTKGIGPAWASQWAMRGQFIGYTWAGREYGHKIKGTIVRAVSIQKTMNKEAEAIVPYGDALIDRWYKSTCAIAKRMIDCWKKNSWEYDFADACGAWGGCDFQRLCEAPNPDSWMGLYQERERR